MKISSTERVLAGTSSIFLDGLRFLAALIVLVTHARAVWFPENELDKVPSNLSHGAVVFFFVLSGFVIAHTTTHNNRGAAAYAVARLSRLYSIFLPAMFLTILIVVGLKYFDKDIYQQYAQNQLTFRFLISLLFSNELWFLTSAPIINGPIWSLSYEFWFYVIFGCFYYRKEGIKGLLLSGLVCLIAGPKILLMMLMWLLGWLVYHLPRPKITVTASWLLVFVLVLLGGYFMVFLPSWPNEVHTTRLHWADKFASDGIVSLFVGAAFWLLPNGVRTQNTSSLVKKFRVIADFTFPIYVMHFPLLVLSKSMFSGMASRGGQFVSSLTFVALSCAVIGLFLESRREYWNKFFKKAVSYIPFQSSKI